MRLRLLTLRAWHFFLALFFPLSALVPFICLDNSYPLSDASEYFSGAYDIYTRWKHDGWIAGVQSLYTLRIHKQVLLPAFGSLVLALTGGDILWTIRICNLLFFTVFLIFTFLAFELILSSAESAIATALLGLLPWCSFSAHYLGAEMPVLACCAGAFYWLIRCKDMDSVRAASWFGIFLGLGTCFHVASTPLFFLVPIGIWIAMNLRHGRLRVFDVFAGISALSFVFLIPWLIYSVLKKKTNQSNPALWSCLLILALCYALRAAHPDVAALLFFCTPALVVRMLRRPLELNPSFTQAAWISAMIVFGWYAPYLHDVVHWVSSSSYTGHANLMAGMSHFYMPGRFILWLGGVPLLLVAVAFTVGVFRKRFSQSERFYIWAALASVAFPVLVGATTADYSLRYYFACALILYSIGIYFALSKSKVSRGMVAGIAALCWAWNIAVIFIPEYAPRILPEVPLQEFFYPRTPIEEDLMGKMLDSLATVIPPEKQKVTVIQIISMDLMYYFIHPYRFGYMARERGMEWDQDLTTTPDPSSNYAFLVMKNDPHEDVFLQIVKETLPKGWELYRSWPISGLIMYQGFEGKLLLYKKTGA